MPSVGGSVFCLGLDGVPQALGPALDPLDQSFNSLVAMKLQVGVWDYAAEPEKVFGGDNVSCTFALTPCSVGFLVGPPRGGPQGYYLPEVLSCYSPQVFVRGPWFAFVPDVGLVDLFFPEVSDVFLDPVLPCLLVCGVFNYRCDARVLEPPLGHVRVPSHEFGS